MRFTIIVVMIILAGVILSCDKKTTGPGVTDSLSTWTRVDAFGTQPIWGLYVSSDSTELHVMTTDMYGYHQAGRPVGSFSTQSLTYPIEYESNGMSDFLPSFTDEYCFYCTEDGEVMHVYNIQSGEWDKRGELNVHELVPDSTDMRECFGRSYWVNLPNHIVDAEDSDFFVTVETIQTYADRAIRLEDDFYGSHCQRFLLNISADSQLEWTEVYRTEVTSTPITTVPICSSHYLYSRFLQFSYDNDEPFIILTKESPLIISGDCRYPVRDIIVLENQYIGLADGIIMTSTDQGTHWSEWLSVNGSWSYTCIEGHHVLFYWNNIADWFLEEDPSTNCMLESEALLGHMIFFIRQLDDVVYVATDQGLYVRSVSSFLTPRPESRSGETLEIGGK